MKVIRSIEKMAEFSKDMRLQGKTIGFVPTMGALHRGHIGLIRQARQENDKVAVSIFVNPIQFGPKEDYKRYPRNLKLDAQLCEAEGVDVIFYPVRQQMYLEGHKTYIFVSDLSDALCGKFRPLHFRGVATVVAKLFNIVSPSRAYFGQKDAQQAIIIKRMVSDLNIPVKIKVMPIVREKDGLAMSSRNIYLSKDERQDAVVLYRALMLAKNLIQGGAVDITGIIKKMKQLIVQKKSSRVQYISIVDPEDLSTVSKIKDKVLIALGVWIGKTRLVDNVIINPKSQITNHRQIPIPKSQLTNED